MNTATISVAGTAEWHEARRHYIGASEAAAACGLSPYRQPLDVYLEKRGLADPPAETEAMRLGTLLEPVVVAEYEHRTGSKTRACESLHHPLTPWIGATPDRLVISAAPTFPLEAKTSTWRRAAEFGEEGTDELPADYLCQCQQQMYVTERDRCDLAVLLDGRTLRVYTVRRHDQLIERMVAAETELWQRIQAGDPPPPDWSHPHTLDLVRRMHGVDESLTVDLAGETAEAWLHHQRLGDTITKLKKERSAVKAAVLHAMGSAAVGRVPSGDFELVRKTVSRKEYTVKASSYIDIRERKVKR